MNAALVPVRSMAEAKNRLAGVLGAEQRRRLALAMLADMLEALGRARSLDRIAVVSADRGLLAQAARLGAETIDEGQPRGLNPAVAMAAERLQASGVKRLLTIPGDVPLIDPAEVERLFATDGRRYPVVLVPSASGTGTNGLLCTPPTIIAPCFEGNSLEAYRNACQRAGIEPLVMRLASFALDVDTREDLRVLAASRRGAAASVAASAGPAAAVTRAAG